MKINREQLKEIIAEEIKSVMEQKKLPFGGDFFEYLSNTVHASDDFVRGYDKRFGKDAFVKHGASAFKQLERWKQKHKKSLSVMTPRGLLQNLRHASDMKVYFMKEPESRKPQGSNLNPFADKIDVWKEFLSEIRDFNLIQIGKKIANFRISGNSKLVDFANKLYNDFITTHPQKSQIDNVIKRELAGKKVVARPGKPIIKQIKR